MRSVYVVSSLPVRDASGAILGWVRADPFADGSRPTDTVLLRDRTACGQAEAVERVARNLKLLYATRDEAVRDGLARLREADSNGEVSAA